MTEITPLVVIRQNTFLDDSIILAHKPDLLGIAILDFFNSTVGPLTAVIWLTTVCADEVLTGETFLETMAYALFEGKNQLAEAQEFAKQLAGIWLTEDDEANSSSTKLTLPDQLRNASDIFEPDALLSCNSLDDLHLVDAPLTEKLARKRALRVLEHEGFFIDINMLCTLFEEIVHNQGRQPGSLSHLN